MKKELVITLFAIFILTIFNCKASVSRDTTRVHNEFTFSNYNLNLHQTGFKYARRLSDRYWLKLGIQTYINSIENRPLISITYRTVNTNIISNIHLGIEKHSVIRNNIELNYGLNVLFGDMGKYNRTDNPQLAEKLRSTSIHEFAGSIGLIFGLYYNFSDNFSIGAELNPNIIFGINGDIINRRYYFEYPKVSIFCLKYKL